MTPLARILVVRLGALGDLVHTLPVIPALRAAMPSVEIHWLVEERHAALTQLVEGVDAWVFWEFPRFGGPRGLRVVVPFLRSRRYDAALDLQGLIRSAVLARASGAARVIGFPSAHLREKPAALFYSEQPGIGDVTHVVDRQLGLLRAVGISDAPRLFPLRIASTPVADAAIGLARGRPFALLVPGAGWPNKEWGPERFGALASTMASRWGWRAIVTWGPNERTLAEEVVRAASGAACLAPSTGVADLAALAPAAEVVVGGDTGPIHLSEAAGGRVVCVLGPTDPARNGPALPGSGSVSRFSDCSCRYARSCRRPLPCIATIGVDEVLEEVARVTGVRGTRAVTGPPGSSS
ncbi:MAG: glycosyltransferase family 9 protein [Holophagales bacterium]|nr:glycosyltransferase family 9 protein [Holophagales bacterium]MBK9968481.1 glycosyltransferase family 9 protein [Holophagales bacterium]